MTEGLMRFPAWVGLPIFCLLTIGLGVGTLFLFKWIFGKLEIGGDSERVAANVLRVSGALLGLLLSLTFSSVLTKTGKLRDAVELEAAQLVDIHHDLEQFDDVAASEIQEKVVAYTKALIDKEWAELANDRLSEEAQGLFEEIQLGILDLETEGQRQVSLRSNLIQDIDEVSDYRQTRLHHATTDSLLFLSIALVGFVVVSALFSIHKMTAASIIFVSMYFTFVGVVLYVILAMNDPFSGGGNVSPDPIKTVYRDMVSADMQ